jgi:hypothetical protein
VIFKLSLFAFLFISDGLSKEMKEAFPGLFLILTIGKTLAQ